MSALISFKHVYKTYDTDRHALRDINLDIHPSELVFVSGASGAGKTTLFKLISTQEKISSGELSFKSTNLNSLNITQTAAYRKNLGIVFQDFRLIPELNIFENIAVPLKIQKLGKKDIQLKVQEILERFNLKNYEKNFPDYISGGEKQRVAIARAIIHNPNLVIADEPTGNLDRKNAHIVLDLFKDLAQKGVAVLIATHDEDLLKEKKSRQLVLETGQLIKDASQ